MNALTFFCLSLWRRGRTWCGKTYVTELTDEMPDRLLPATVYLVGEGEYLWNASMICPCGCGQALHMNLQPDSRPLWRATRHPDGTVTLHPSVWRQKGCRAHFWFRNGAVQWAEPKPSSASKLP